MYQYKLTTLKNGLRLITVPMPQLESVTVLVGVGVGSRDESDSKAGLCHFLEHMASKGTKKRPTPFSVASIIDSVGGMQNAGTAKEITEYWVKLSSSHLGRAFDFLADNLLNSIYKPEQIEKERKVIIEEINLYEDTPTRKILEIFDMLLYGNTPLGRYIIGNKKTVSQIKRSDFLNFLERHYQPSNIAIVVAGNFDQKKVAELTQKYFSGLKRKSKIKKKKIKYWQKKPKIKLKFKKTDQAHFCFGAFGVNYEHSDRFAVAVLASILGYSRTSRIYRQIREKRGLAYYVYTSPEFYTDTGSLFSQAGVKLDKLDQAVGLIKKEYFRLTKELVKANELQRAKEYIKGRFILSLEDSLNIASRYALQILIEKKIRTPKETLRLIDQVTAEDILRVARRLFHPEKLNLAIIGPYKNEARFKKLL